jgi:hypothetical protein
MVTFHTDLPMSEQASVNVQSKCKTHYLISILAFISTILIFVYYQYIMSINHPIINYGIIDPIEYNISYYDTIT